MHVFSLQVSRDSVGNFVANPDYDVWPQYTDLVLAVVLPHVIVNGGRWISIQSPAISIFTIEGELNEIRYNNHVINVLVCLKTGFWVRVQGECSDDF